MPMAKHALRSRTSGLVLVPRFRAMHSWRCSFERTSVRAGVAELLRVFVVLDDGFACVKAKEVWVERQ